MTLGIPERKLRVIAPDVGGGFGGKLGVMPEEMLCVLVAQKLGKPVKWTETRSESLLAAHHGRDQIQDITITAKKDGTVTGLDVHLLADMGAYLGPGRSRRADPRRVHVQRDLQDPGATSSPAPTSSPTRRRPTPTAAPGARRRRSPSSGSWTSSPSSSAGTRWSCASRTGSSTRSSRSPPSRGLTYDTGNYEAATEQAMETFDYAGLRREQEERRAQRRPGAARHRHLDVHRDVRPRPVAGARLARPTARAAGRPPASGCWPPARSRSITGSSAHGQGHETAFSQIVADQLGVPFEDVEILHGDTQVSPKGLDTYGSRSLVVGGIAVVKAAEKVVEKAKKVAAHLLEASEDDIEFANGSFTVRAPTRARRSRRSRSRRSCRTTTRRASSPRWTRDAVFDPENFSFPHGTHLAAIEVDTETGRVTLRKYVCVDDVGNVVNPLIVEGQMHGGLAQGIAQALFEEANYDEQGTLVNGTFVDYTLPSAADLPSFTTDAPEHPGHHEPAGRQGCRRGGHDRLHPGHRQRRHRRDPPPRRHRRSRCPCTSQRVWRAIQDGQGPVHRRRPRSTPTRPVPASARSTRTTPRERSSDPVQVRLRPADVGRGGGHGAAARAGTTPRSSPAGRACCRCCGCDSPRRP